MSSKKLSAKEREILKRQKQLAARLKPPGAPSDGGAPSSASAAAPPKRLSATGFSTKPVAPQRKLPAVGKRPSLKKGRSAPGPLKVGGDGSGNGKSSAASSFMSKFGMKPAPAPPPKKPATVDLTKPETVDLTKDSSGRSGAAAPAPAAPNRPIRPSLKNRRTPQQAALIASERAKQASSASLPAVKKKNKANSDSKSGSKNDNNNDGANRGSLAQWVQNVSSTATTANSFEAATFGTVEPEDFWRNLRDWDFCAQYIKMQQQQQQQQQGNNNNNRGKQQQQQSKDDSETSVLSVRPLPNIFMSIKQYVALWAPLCMAECRAQLLQEAAQIRPRAPMTVQVEVMKDGFNKQTRGMAAEHNWDSVELDATIHLKLQPVRGGRGETNPSVMTNDLCLLLAQQDFFTLAHNRSLGTVGATAAGFITHAEVSRGKGWNNVIVKCNKRKWAKYGQTQMYLVVLACNVTAWREFTALCQLDQLPLKRFLLAEHLEDHRGNSTNARNKRLSSSSGTEELLQKMGGTEALGKGFIEYASNKFNASQLTAIAASAHEYGEGGFTLIKGPPGTGKTTTLVAVLNSLHIRQYNKYYAEVRRIAAEHKGTKQNALQMARKAKPRLLVCAPSNAAVDNIILKIMQDGFIDGQGKRYNPSMIRVGVGQSAAVRAVALETKVDSILGENLDVARLENSIAAYRVELARITKDMHSLRERVHIMATAAPWPLSRDWEIRVDEENWPETKRVYFVNHREKKTTYEVPPPPEPGETQFPATSMPEYRAYVSRIVKLVESYFTIKSNLERCTVVKSGHDQGANQFEVRMNLEAHVLNEVHLVMTTLGTAGNRTLEQTDKFEVVVVDEAAQSVEPATLAALQLGSRHAVLVGDPQQLPATIFNVSGRNSKYDRSLFQRLEEAGQPVYMLNEQYRMHPDISEFPREVFYDKKLLDGPNVVKPDYGNTLRAVVNCAVPHFKPFTILDLDSTEERGGTSLSNRQEAQLAVFLYQRLTEYARDLCTSEKVAIITPYSQQVGLLRRMFEDALGRETYERYVEINSVDAFQGREANIVIFSAVRAAGSKGIGFLSDVRRMNVALTRAKYFLFVLARCDSIVVNPYWRQLVTKARERGAVIKVPKTGGRGNNYVRFEPPQNWPVQGGGPQQKPPRRLPGSEPDDEEDGEIAEASVPPPPPPRPPPPPPPPPRDPRKRPPPSDPRNHDASASGPGPVMEYAATQPTMVEKPVDPRLLANTSSQTSPKAKKSRKS